MNTPAEAATQLMIFLGAFFLGKYLPELFDSMPSPKTVVRWITGGSMILALAWNTPLISLLPQIQIVSILLFWVGIQVWASAERNPDYDECPLEEE